MQRYPAHLFGPGLAPGGEPAELELSSFGLRVLPPHESSAPLSAVTLTLAGFELDEWQLAWSSGGAQYAAHIADRAAIARLVAAPPAGLKPQVAAVIAAERRRKRRTAAVWSAAGFFLLSPLIAFGALVWQADRLIDWVVDHIPVEQEKKLGELVFAGMALKPVEQGPAADAVQRIGARLVQGSRYDYRFKLVASPEVNAFAVPGGTIVVYTGLLARTSSAEELAGVLAHEVQHIERRHSLKAIVNNLGLTAALSLALGDPGGGVVAGAVDGLARLSFGRDQEREADLHGLETLRKTGIAPHGMLSFYRKMARQEDAMPPQLLSTHPPSAERFAAIEAALREKGAWASTPLPYDWHTVATTVK